MHDNSIHQLRMKATSCARVIPSGEVMLNADEPFIGRPAKLVFVACVEAGSLEMQTIWLAESLRRWGGRLAESEFYAVTPRRGLPLAGSTFEAFERLQVQYAGLAAPHRYGWWGPMNKPAALAHVEGVSKADIVVWMDSDTLVLREPTALSLEREFDYAAYPASRLLDIGTNGHDGHEAYWRAVCLAHGIDPERYSWIPAQEREGGQIRMYWQSGVFAYRRATSLGQRMLERSIRQMEARIAAQASGIYFHEQTALGVAVHADELRYKVLEESYNMPLNKLNLDESGAGFVKDARILHYFGSAWPDFFSEMVGMIRVERPDVAGWLWERGPLADHSPLWKRAVGKVWKRQRSSAAAKFAATCQVI